MLGIHHQCFAWNMYCAEAPWLWCSGGILFGLWGLMQGTAASPDPSRRSSKAA